MFDIDLLSTHADRQGVDISFTVGNSVCLFFSVCTVTDFSGEDKASGVKFCMVVHRVLGRESPILGNFVGSQKPKIGRIGARRQVLSIDASPLH